MDNLPCSFFVYGTLKRGQVRESCWPHAPISVEPAWTLGNLVDLGPYPALLAGQDRVLGELWEIEPSNFSEVAACLDAIEGVNMLGESDLYARCCVEVNLLRDKRSVQANCYFYAQPLPAHQEVKPWLSIGGVNYAQWPQTHN